MTTQVVYPIPLDSEEVWKLFRPAVKRFTDTYRQFDPGAEHKIIVVLNKGDANPEIAPMFKGLPTEYLYYDGDGADLGSQQFAAKETGDAFQVNFTSRAYFHRAGWLKALVEAREKHGPALYGTMASYEGGRLHVCTRAFAYDTADFVHYPHEIVSRDQGVFFELGDGCLLDWFLDYGRPAYLVSWYGVHRMPQWPSIPNGYRNGDQRGCLCFDKHTEIYEKADENEKARLKLLMQGHFCIRRYYSRDFKDAMNQLHSASLEEKK